MSAYMLKHLKECGLHKFFPVQALSASIYFRYILNQCMYVDVYVCVHTCADILHSLFHKERQVYGIRVIHLF